VATERTLDWSTDDTVRHLRASSVFRNLDGPMLRAIADAATILLVTAGEAVITEGDRGDDAFVIVAGRLDVLTANGDDPPIIINNLGPGDVVGEMALITDEPRSATVRARRDSALVRIPADEFRSIVLDHPDVLLDVTRTVMDRLNRSIHGERPERSTRVIGIVPAGTSPAHREFAGDFASVFAGHAVEVVAVDDARAALGGSPTRGEVAQYLHRIEDANDIVILVGDEGDAEWTTLCHRQSDVTLLVGSAVGLGSLGPAEGGVASENGGPSQSHLVLVHGSDRPRNTEQALRVRSTVRHHHVRSGSFDDTARVARIVRGDSVGIVFGGGGARGFAHLGVLKAFLEAGVPIDHVGGASIGSSVAAGYAMGWDWDRIVELARWVTFERGRIVDSTLPAVALGRGRRLTSGMRESYGDTDIRDLWTDFFCVSSDLTDGAVHPHRSGPVWSAVRASVAIPGVLPPMRSAEGHVLVDGGILDNVPTSSMRALNEPRTVIAVDLRAPTALPSRDLPADGDLSGWKVARHRWLPWRERLEVPGIMETLIAASTVSGRPESGDADVVIHPDVERFGFMDFASWEGLIEAGYREGVRAVEEGGVTLTRSG
jgi:predicted acylesterase/phospholipase RssA/CRP-like cAMP-binding protein